MCFSLILFLGVVDNILYRLLPGRSTVQCRYIYIFLFYVFVCCCVSYRTTNRPHQTHSVTLYDQQMQLTPNDISLLLLLERGTCLSLFVCVHTTCNWHCIWDRHTQTHTHTFSALGQKWLRVFVKIPHISTLRRHAMLAKMLTFVV